MNKFFILFAIFAVAYAGDSGVVDDALLARVAQIIGGSDGGSGGSFGSGGDTSGVVDDALLARVASIIGSSGGSSSGGSFRSDSGSYGAPAAPQQSYGSPPEQSYGAPSRSSGGQISIGQPEVAQRVAEFSVGGGSSGRSSGGYSGSSGGY